VSPAVSLNSNAVIPAPVQCPICKNQAPFYAWHPEAGLYRCEECGHRFSVLFTQNSAERYGPEYFEQIHRNWFMNPDLAHFDELAGFIKADGTAQSIIDVGCGKGSFLGYLAARMGPALSLTGIDLSPNPPDPTIEYISGDVMTVPILRQFDVVVSLAVIEHVADVHNFVNKLHDLCRPNGRVIVTTVNDDSLLYVTARALRHVGFTLPFNRLYSCHHLHHFTRRSLIGLLEQKGLTIETVILHNAPLAAIDIPVSPMAIARLLRLAVGVLFIAGHLARRTYQQTVVCRKDDNHPISGSTGAMQQSALHLRNLE
jgi:2-polyprenyl-3-methyl-5-hydroxy-6-metoxy-1,4-benzoquinol methylase